MSDQLVLERSDSVLIMRLNRPEARNALTGALVRQISSTLLDAEADPATRVLVITGTGDRAFCGGMDLADFADSGEDEFATSTRWKDSDAVLARGPRAASHRRRERKRRRRRIRTPPRLRHHRGFVRGSIRTPRGQTRAVSRRRRHLLGHAPPTRRLPSNSRSPVTTSTRNERATTRARQQDRRTLNTS